MSHSGSGGLVSLGRWGLGLREQCWARPGHPAHGPVVRACLREADGSTGSWSCSAVAGPLPPWAQLGCTLAGSGHLEDAAAEALDLACSPCARTSGC